MSLAYQIKTEVFEGPLDTLLSLIEKRKLLINEISLAQIADDYIAYVRAQNTLPIKDTAHFLLIASTLVLIKSKSLLPALSLSEEEQGDILDLEERLRALKRMRDVSRHVKNQFGVQLIFFREPSRNGTIVFAPDHATTEGGLRAAIHRVLSLLPKKEILPEVVVKKIISLEEMITRLAARVQRALAMSFRDFAEIGKEEKVNIAVSFLAMLELVKQGIIEVKQEAHFSDISMESRAVGTPRYG